MPSVPASRPFHRISVLMGGPSREHEISMKSGRAIARALQTEGYHVDAIVLHDRSISLPAGTDAVFVALHGTFGEDGDAQHILEQSGIPYTGAGPTASRLSFDKQHSQTLLEDAGLPVPSREFLETPRPPASLSFPLVVKPPRQGSSIGVHIVHSHDTYPAAFQDAAQHGLPVMLEAYIPGRELTVGLLDGRALPVIEIRPPAGNFDYAAKYQPVGTIYDVPAQLPPQLSEICRRQAEEAYRVLGCASMSRVDFRLDHNNQLYILENNTIPGFTETSLLPKAARAAGISFGELCRRILETASCGKP